MNTATIGRGACFALGLLGACDRETADWDEGDESTDAIATAETETAHDVDTGDSPPSGTSSTTSAPDPSNDDDGSTSSEPDAGESSGESSSSTGELEPPCIDPHFVIFLAPDGNTLLDVPAEIEVMRFFADGGQQATDCTSAAPGGCMIHCIVSDVGVDALELIWPCADGTAIATYYVVAPPSLIEVDLAAAEAMAGCG